MLSAKMAAILSRGDELKLPPNNSGVMIQFKSTQYLINWVTFKSLIEAIHENKLSTSGSVGC